MNVQFNIPPFRKRRFIKLIGLPTKGDSKRNHKLSYKKLRKTRYELLRILINNYLFMLGQH